MRTQTNASQSLRPKHAAEFLEISKATLLRWEREKPDFPKPSRPSPRVTLYDRDKLSAFVEAHVATDEPQAA